MCAPSSQVSDSWRTVETSSTAKTASSRATARAVRRARVPRRGGVAGGWVTSVVGSGGRGASERAALAGATAPFCSGRTARPLGEGRGTDGSLRRIQLRSSEGCSHDTIGTQCAASRHRPRVRPGGQKWLRRGPSWSLQSPAGRCRPRARASGPLPVCRRQP